MPTDPFAKRVLAALHSHFDFSVKRDILAERSPWTPQTKADHNMLRSLQERRYREYWSVMDAAQQREYLIKAGADPDGEMPKVSFGKHVAKAKAKANYRDLTNKKKRQRLLKKCLHKVASGREGVQSEPADAVALLKDALPQEHKQAIAQSVRGETEDGSWSNLAKQLVPILMKANTRKRAFPAVAVARSLRLSGWTSRKLANKAFGIEISVRQWRLSADEKNVVNKDVHVNNGRLNFRKFKGMKDILHEHSVPTCTFIPGTGRKRQAPVEADQYVMKRARTENISQIHAQCLAGNKEQGVPASCGLSTAYRYAKHDHSEIVRASGRKLDYCTRCAQWDNGMQRQCRAALFEWRNTLKAVWPTYWQKWEEEVLPTISKVGQGLSVEFCTRFEQYIASHRSWDERKTHLSPAECKALWKSENDILKELRSAWKALAADERDGLIAVVKWWHAHFTVRDNQDTHLKAQFLHPPLKVLNFWTDYGQSRTLPIGPVETSAWWYANARLQVNLMGWYIWGTGRVPMYIVLLSDILDHSCTYTQAGFERVLQEVGPCDAFDSLQMWSDVGKHYRATQHLSYWLYTLPKKHKKTTRIDFLEAEHGKGVLDAMFGRIQMWTKTIARTTTIKAVAQWANLLQARADSYVKINPGGPVYKFIHFKPGPRKQYGRDWVDFADIGIRCNSTYSLSSSLTDGGDVVVSDHVLTGKPAQVRRVAKLLPKPLAGADLEDAPDETTVLAAAIACANEAKEDADGWKRAFRKTAPEESKPHIKKMRNTFSALFDGRDALRDSMVWASRRKPAAEQKEKTHMQRFRFRKAGGVKAGGVS